MSKSLFKKFTIEDNVSSVSVVKNSVARAIRGDILTQMPGIEPYIEEILPKKEPVYVAKCSDHISIVVVNHEPLFFNVRDGPYLPMMRLLHRYPDILPHMRCDKGAIKYCISGANIMCPGLTHPNATMTEGMKAGQAVAIMAEGKVHAMAVGVMAKSVEEIRTINKDIGIENYHHIGDGLWNITTL